MHKRIILISFSIILSLVLTACQQEPERTKSKNQEDIPSSAKGITIQLEKEQYTTEDTEAKLILSNDSETTFVYGTEYTLEKNVNDTWYAVPFKEGIGFNTMAYHLTPNQTVNQTISLDIFNENLSAGHYRIIHAVNDNAENYSLGNKIMIADSFEVVE